MNDAGRANPDRDTVLKLAGASPPPPPNFSPGSTPESVSSATGAPGFSPSPAALAMAGAEAGEPHKPKKPPTCLDRSQILDATARVLREKGYDGTTIRAIAKQLDCAVGSIYRYFDGKRTLLDAVCQRRFEAVAEHAELRAGPVQPVTAYARAATEQPEQYRLMFWLSSVGAVPGEEAVPEVVRRIINGWAESLGGIARARRVWAQLHGYIMLGYNADQAVTLLDLNPPPPAPEPEATEAETGGPDQATQAASNGEVVGVATSSAQDDLTLL